MVIRQKPSHISMNFSVLLTKICRYRLFLLRFLLVCELQLLGERRERGKCVCVCDKEGERANVHVPHTKLSCAVQFLSYIMTVEEFRTDFTRSI